ncbi:MAG TPA: aminotransferase class I/II-fold pyridoxal phosphate-dependent enzyme [Actinomycetota bacterium]|nr:aminotransferase class I/II-fold pyridoxal phosphate-dependent enzyme [Actinomycetota bacterium]
MAITEPAVAPDPALRQHGDTEARPGDLDFAVSVVPGPLRAGIQDTLAEVLAGAPVDRYPDESGAIGALARRHHRSPDEVLVLNGAAEGFWLLAGALRPRQAVCVHPSFTEPEAALRAHGVRVERAWRRPPRWVLGPAAIDPAADLVVTGNPNNPTGTMDGAASLAGLASAGRILVVDEAFMDLVDGPDASLTTRSDLPGLVVVRSLTKVLGIPGIRAGYLLGPAWLVAALREHRPPWSVGAPALALLEAYGRGSFATQGIAAAVAVERAELTAQLRGLPGVEVGDSAANFLLLRVPGGDVVWRALRARHIAVRRAVSFPGLTPDHLRVAVRTREDNQALVAALRAALAPS